MQMFYCLPDHDDALLHDFRMLFGSLMAISVMLGFAGT